MTYRPLRNHPCAKPHCLRNVHTFAANRGAIYCRPCRDQAKRVRRKESDLLVGSVVGDVLAARFYLVPRGTTNTERSLP